MFDPKACIFDLDGVVVDTAHYHFKAWKRLAKALSVPFSEEENHQLKGLSRRKSLLKILEMGDKRLSEEKMQQLMARKNEWYLNYVAGLGPTDILDGISDFLDELDERNIKKAIGSSSKNAKQILKTLRLTNRFGAIIDGASVVHTKPDPEVFLKGAKELGVAPDACIVFEDATSGVEAANQAGMVSIGVGAAKHFYHADAVIPSFKGMTLDKVLKLLES